jgi:spore germination protein GerM
MNRRALIIGAIVAVAALLAWVLFVALPRRYGPHATSPATATAPAAPAAPAAGGRKIKARLFYVAEDGVHLMSVEREITYGEGTLEQAREIVAAQVAPVTDPLVSAIPPGTTVRALFITEGGEAFVDLSPDVMTYHSGGTNDELLTVYTLVNALTENLPAVTAVQLLVDGKEVDSLTGHVDLRTPLAKNLTWVQ